VSYDPLKRRGPFKSDAEFLNPGVTAVKRANVALRSKLVGLRPLIVSQKWAQYCD
jgi:hypothetical protein